MKRKTLVAGAVALAITVGSGALVTGNVNAAAAVQKMAGHFGFKGVHNVLESTEMATLLGLTSNELRTELKSGKTLAAIAAAKGVDTQKIIDLETKLLTADLDQRLKNGKITQAEYDTQKAAIATTAKEIINGTFAGKGGSGHSPFESAVLTNAGMAKLLGLSTTELSTQLKAGKSLSALATEKGVAVQSVIDLEIKAITAALDQQLKDGKITQSQYDTLKASITTWATEIVNDTRIGKGGGKGGHEGHGGLGRADVLSDSALATLLGTTTAELQTAVQSGKSLATIAGEKHVAVQSVIDQVTKTLTVALDKQLADKIITQAKYDEEKSEIVTEAPQIVNNTFSGKGGPGDHGGRGGKGGHGGRDGL
jgi:DNA-binding transcriptional regulator YdaS (Cro superfamily)